MRDKKTKQLIVGMVALLVVTTAGTAGLLASRPQSSKPQVQASTTQSEQPANAEYISYKGEDGKNALELLKTHAKVVTKDSSYGPFVDSIDGVQGGVNGKYWAFYINGQMSQVGASGYTTKNGDKLEWKLE